MPEGAAPITLIAEDGVRLDARLFAAGPERIVVLLHAYHSDQREWFAFARELQALGLAALTLDFRGYGGSAGGGELSHLDRDARAAVQFARSRGYQRVVLIGASMGATAALVAGAAEQVSGIAVLSAPVRFRGLDAGDAAAALRVPMLAVAARDDISAAQSLEQLAKRAGLDASHAVLIEGRAHGTALLAEPYGARVRASLLALLAEVWGAPSR